VDRKARIQAILTESSKKQQTVSTNMVTASLVTVFALAALFVFSGYIYSRGFEKGALAAAEQPEGSVPATWQIISPEEEQTSYARPANFDIQPPRKSVDLYEPLQPLNI